MKKRLLIAAVGALCAATIAQAGGFGLDVRPQLSAKIIGVTVRRGCPTEELIQEIRAEGNRRGATYTAFPEAGSANLCPAQYFGQMWSYTYPDLRSSSDQFGFDGTIATWGGVTVGIHYRVME